MAPFDLTGTADKYSWFSDAECVNHPKLRKQLEGFNGSSISRQALDLCERCPVRKNCIQHAYDHNAEFGYFGGLSPAKRREFGSAKKAIMWLEQQGRIA